MLHFWDNIGGKSGQISPTACFFVLIFLTIETMNNPITFRKSKCIFEYVKVTNDTLKARHNGRHFPDDIFELIFLNENVWIAIEILFKFVPRGPVNNISALVL